MHKVHAGYTILAPLRWDRVDEARALLEELHANPADLPFAAVTTLHFARGTVLRAAEWGGEELPPTLLIATSFSGPVYRHVDELVAVCGVGLRRLFSLCVGFPEVCSDEHLAWFMRDHRRRDTFYSGMSGLSRADVLRQQQLRVAIEDFVDRERPTGDALQIQAAIQTFVRKHPDHKWAAEEPWEQPTWAWWARNWRGALLVGVLLPSLLALVGLSIAFPILHGKTLGLAVAAGWLTIELALLAVFGLVVGVRVAETQQDYAAGRPPDAKVREIAATQNHVVINEMTVAGPIKEGRARPPFLRLALWLVAQLAPTLNIPTVATARWIPCDRGRRLIFISNFTNAAEPYVRDFIDVRFGAMRINLTFGFGGGYPRTEWIVRDGAVTDSNGFIHVVNTNQQVTELWFCPYGDLSIDNIQLDRKIREGLFEPYTEDQAKVWLELL